MPNKRSRCKKTQHFHCPVCQKRLWRLGSSKIYMYYENAQDIREHVGITLKKAKFIASGRSSYMDTNQWIEEFFCEDHGTIWLFLSRKKDKKLVSRVATEKDWQRTNKTIDPDRPNPSVSQFTHRMSRNRIRSTY